MSKNKNIVILQYILSFTIPFFVIILAYIGLRIIPFGDRSLVMSDAKSLYISDLSYIQRVLWGQEDLLYSFKQGIGMNLMGSHSGLLNPANIIVLFFDITNYTEMYSWLLAIDISVCGLTMYHFLSKTYERKGSNLIFSTVYALIGFNVAYCFHYNFILSVELLPLIALGIKKIIRGKSPWLYLVSLSYAIFASFYFGYMLCIASFVFFIIWFVEEGKNSQISNKRIFINYSGSSIAAGLIPALVWMPALSSFAGGRLNQNSITDFSFSENASLFDIFAKLFIGTNSTNELVDGCPNIFCGSLVLFLAIAFFIDRRNKSRIKVIHALPLVFYFITFYIKAFSMVMQGFSVTNWFNYRYSFVFSFLLILIAYEEYQHFREIEVQDFKRTLTVFAVFVIAVFSRQYSFVNGGEMILGVFLLSLMLGAIWWNRINEAKAPHRVLVIMLVLLVSIELYANYMISTKNIIDWGVKKIDYIDSVFYKSGNTEALQSADKSFYRMANEEGTNERCNNDPRLFGYNGVNYFGSCESYFVYYGMTKLGMPWWSNRMWYSKGLPSAFDSLLGIKYIVAKRDLAEEKKYDALTTSIGGTIYHNPFALPIGFVTKEKVSDVSLDRNPFLNHNNLWKTMTGIQKDVFTQEYDISFTYHEGFGGKNIDYTVAREFSTSYESKSSNNTSVKNPQSIDNNNGELISGVVETVDEVLSEDNQYVEYSFIASQDGPVYAYNGISVDDINGAVVGAMDYLGYFKKGEVVTGKISFNGDITSDMLYSICAEFLAAYANEDAFAEHSKWIQGHAGIIDKITDSHLVGNAEVDDGCRLFFTIPYDEGWTIKVDGEENTLEKTADLFMSVTVSAGTHTYELTYFPPRMRTGMMVSVGGSIILLILILFNMLYNKRKVVLIADGEDITIEKYDVDQEKSQVIIGIKPIKIQSDKEKTEQCMDKGDD